MLRPPSPKMRRRPTELSMPVLLGSSSNGQRPGLRVKNTFLDAPSGLTPTSMRDAACCLKKSGMRSAPPMTGPGGSGSTGTTLDGSFMRTALLEAVRAEDQLSTPSSVDRYDSGAFAAALMLRPTGQQDSAQQSSSSSPRDVSLSKSRQHTDVQALHCAISGSAMQDDAASASSESDEEGAEQAKPPIDAPARPEGAEHPSVGSDLHESGNCKRCCFFPRGRCLHGYLCEFCHYDHERRKRKSKKKKKAGTLFVMSEDEQEKAAGAVENLAGVVVNGTSTQAEVSIDFSTCVAAPPATALQLPAPTTSTVSVEYLADAVATGTGLGVASTLHSTASASTTVDAAYASCCADGAPMEASSPAVPAAPLSTAPCFPSNYGAEWCNSVPHMWQGEGASAFVPQVYSLEPAVSRATTWAQQPASLQVPEDCWQHQLPTPDAGWPHCQATAPQQPAPVPLSLDQHILPTTYCHQWSSAQPYIEFQTQPVPALVVCPAGEATPPPPARSPRLPAGVGDRFRDGEGSFSMAPSDAQVPLWLPQR